MSKRNDLKDLINRANKVHNNKFDYSLIVTHKSMHDYQNVICPKHGIFKVPLHWHINKGRGCPGCELENKTDTKEKFVEKANKVHNSKYNYDDVIYKNARTKIIINCDKHGSFSQRPMDHLNAKQGCPVCKESKGESIVTNFLKQYNIKYKPQKSFDDLRHKSLLFFDFYLTELNICIEFDGEQHFRTVMGWGGEEGFKILQLRDKLKTEYCITNNIPLLRLTYKDYDDDTITSKLMEFLHIKESRIITKFSSYLELI